MLKPRYRTLNESVSDFNRMLEGMNRTAPVERMHYQEMEELVREEQELHRLDKEIEHTESVIAGSGSELSEADKSAMAQQYDQMHDRYHTLANKHGRLQQRAQRTGNPALAAKHAEVRKRFRRKGKEYGQKNKALIGKRNIEDGAPMESVDPAPMSRYQSRGSALQSFRILAGLEEQTMLPRDAGLLGTTRHNANYDEMAAPLMEAEDAGHKRRMKRIAGKIHQAASAIDREYGGEAEEDEADI